MTRHDDSSTLPLSHLDIDLGAVSHNVAAFRQLVGSAVQIAGVVKKNAYGLGAVTLAHRLLKAGCDMLVVYSPAEADELGQGAVVAPLLVLYPVRGLSRTEGLYRAAVAGRLHLTVHDLPQIDQLNAVGQSFGIRLPLHLYVDTGMSRGGLSAEDFAAALAKQATCPYVKIVGVMSHLATASNDPVFAAAQLERFDNLLEIHRTRLPDDVLIHVANTYGTLRSTPYHRSLVRPGLGLYGYGAHHLEGPPRLAPGLELRPCVRWMSRLIHVAPFPRGATVGYGATQKLRRQSLLGLIPVGYGDGYPLLLSKKAVVRVRLGDDWHPAPVLGRVNMDQITIDLTDLRTHLDGDVAALTPGCEVEIYSNNPDAPNALPRLAELAQSHCYELLCRLDLRIPRQYVN